jgi:hypothetical protein
VTPELLALLRFETKLEKALALGGFAHSLSDIMEAVALNRAQVFHSEGGVLVTEIVSTKRGPVLNIWLTAGDMEDCVELSREAVAAATEYGCVSATFTGRMGWLRTAVVGSDGWRPRAVVFAKDL